MDNETWLIEVGDKILEKKANSSYTNLNEIDKAIYCLWVIDYAVRNSGTLEPVKELHHSAIQELKETAKSQNWPNISNLLKLSDNEVLFCEKYYEQYEDSCNEIRLSFKNT